MAIQGWYGGGWTPEKKIPTRAKVEKWRIDLRDQDGNRFREQLDDGTTRTEAKDRHREVKALASRKRRDDVGEGYVAPRVRKQQELENPAGQTYAEFIDDKFLEDYRGKNGKPASTCYEETFSKTGRIMKALGDIPLPEITEEKLEWFQRKLEKKVSASTVRKQMRAIALSLKWAKRWGHIEINPAADLMLPPEPDSESRPLTDRQWRAIREKLTDDPHPDRRMAHFAICTGARLGELRRLKWADLDQDAGFVTLRSPKGGKWLSRDVALTDDACEALPKQGDNEHVFTDPKGNHYDNRWRGVDCSHRFKQACCDAGVPWASFKTLRTTFGSWAEEEKVSVEHTAKALGHRDVRTTQRHYRKSRVDQTRPAVEAVGCRVGHFLVTPDEDQEQAVS